GNNKVVSRQIELLDRDLHQREKIPVDAWDENEFLQKTGRERLAHELVTKPALGEIDQAEEIRFRKFLQHFREDFLRPRVSHKPFVNKCDSHKTPMFSLENALRPV